MPRQTYQNPPQPKIVEFRTVHFVTSTHKFDNGGSVLYRASLGADGKIVLEEIRSDNLFNFNLSNTQNGTVSYSMNIATNKLKSGILMKATMTNDGKVKVEPWRPALDIRLSN